MISLWQQPQNLIGWLVLQYHRKICKHPIEKITNNSLGITYYVVKHVNNCGVSLGDYIFLDSDSSIHEKDVKHEYGHQLQSKRLGWFYLILIGLPSVIGNIYSRIFKKDNRWYYNQPWERNADKLGGVIR